MVFSSSVFLFIFLPIVLGGYYLIQPKFRNAFLLLASLCFYGYGEPKFLLALLASILMNYLAALFISRQKRAASKKLILSIAIALNLSLLFVFKYLNFLSLNLSRIIPSIGVTSIALPIGISFFTFQAMSYVIDVYRGERAQKNPLDLGLYISLFPQLVAGPIVRYKTIEGQIGDRQTSFGVFSEGVTIFLKGLFKKIIFANNVAIIADKAFSGEASGHSVLFLWLGALAYTLQIYFDFSGYSDMAIGLGRMFGFSFPVNFDHPYIAKSITDFWRRWHISLSSWFRDYVYIPLGGSRGGTARHLRNLAVVWLLTGIWHGANWTFLFWGLAYFALLVTEKYFIRPDRFEKKSLILFYRILTFLAVMLCWAVFRADSIGSAGSYFASMLGLSGNPLWDGDWQFYSREYLVLIIFALIFCTPLPHSAAKLLQSRVKAPFYETLRALGYAFLFVICISYLVIGSHNPFIYFNF